MATQSKKLIDTFCRNHTAHVNLKPSKKVTIWCAKNNVNYIKTLDTEGLYFIEHLITHGRIYNNDYVNKCNEVDTFVIEYYKKRKNFYKLVEYYTIMCEKGNVEALYQLGEYYKKYEEDPEEMIKYYILCAEHSHPVAVFELGLYYESIGDVENMIKYFEIAAKTHHNLYAINTLGRYYEIIDNKKNMMEYYSLILETGNKCDLHQISAINKFFNYVHFDSNLHMAYKCRSVLEGVYRKRIDQIIDLQIKMTQCMELSMDECGVCLNDSYMHPFLKCSHYVCNDCFNSVHMCPFCRESK